METTDSSIYIRLKRKYYLGTKQLDNSLLHLAFNDFFLFLNA